MRSTFWRELGAARWNEHVRQQLAEVSPGLFLVLNGDLLMPDTVQQAMSAGVRVFIFHADNPLPPWGSNRPETLSAALICDTYLTWSRQLAGQLSEIGVNRVEYLPFAWDPVVWPYVGLSAAPAHQVVFVGGWDKEREAFLKELSEQFDLKIWGPPYWRTRTRPGSPLPRCWQGTAVEGPQAAQILADSAIALNLLRQQNLPDGVNMRTFEVPGCGGFALATRTKGALTILPEDSVGVYFDDLEECCIQIERFLARPVERVELAESAHARVADEHQYAHRARKILDVFHSV